ncbi:MAG: translation initiation factor IF-3 [Actinomycetota bacterium]|nr:translation initiation factor IF-3 [Actinomycetota bacterium]
MGIVKPRANEMIEAPQVRLISEEGKQLGILKVEEALKIAQESGLDLVEVAPQANPPVCRLMEYGKYCYELEQKQKASRKRQCTTVVKEMKMRPKIDIHDYVTKKKYIEKFLEHGNKVKITIMFRGREMAHTDLGRDLLNRLTKDLEELATVESEPNLDGRNMCMVLSPVSEKDRKR